MNRRIFTTLIALTGLVAVAGAASAQNTPGTPGAPGQAGKGGQRQRGAQFARYDAALRGVQLTPEQRTKLRDLNAEIEAKLLAMLTPEQQTAFKEALAQAGNGGGGQQGGAGAMNGLVEELALTPEQKTKVDPILADAQKQMRDLTQNQAQGADRRAMMQQMQQIMTDTKAKIRPLLTPEQQTKLDAYNPRGGRRPKAN